MVRFGFPAGPTNDGFAAYRWTSANRSFEKYIVTARNCREIRLPDCSGSARPRGSSQASAVDLSGRKTCPPAGSSSEGRLKHHSIFTAEARHGLENLCRASVLTDPC